MLLDDESIAPAEDEATANASEMAEKVVNDEPEDDEPDGTEGSSPRQSRFISRVLAPALGFWVRSQLDHVEDLQIAIEAGDRQILAGGIQRVSAAASKAVYQGLHFSQIQVVGQDIQTNLGQLLRGKPLRLLRAFPVTGEVTLTEADLNASLNAPLLADAVTHFLLSFIQPSAATPEPLSESAQLRDVDVQFGSNALTFTGSLVQDGVATAIAIRTRLTIKKGNLLKLEGFQHQRSVADLISTDECPTSFTIPLGADVYLETLSIEADHLLCRGKITVVP